MPFPGGFFVLHNSDGPVVVAVVTESEESSMTPAQAAQLVVAFTEVLMVQANGGRS